MWGHVAVAAGGGTRQRYSASEKQERQHGKAGGIMAFFLRSADAKTAQIGIPADVLEVFLSKKEVF